MTGEGRRRRCLVTGATGYIGGRLVPQLLDAGFIVRVLVRDPRKVAGHSWSDRVEMAVGDAQDAQAVGAALRDVDVGYYLLHSIGTGKDFAGTERRMAEVFAEQARRRGVGRIVYLGGIDSEDEPLSHHLASRSAVGQVLLESGVPTAVLRAAVVIGSGSASFEMLRYLTERLPAMVTPRWVRSRVQPIAVRDVLHYLVGCAGLPPEVNRAFDVGGPDVLTYLEMMQRYAQVANLRRRRIVPVPVLTPKLSSLWVGLVTPVPGGLARPLVESLRNTVVAREHDIAEYVPDPPEGLLGYERSLQLALSRVHTLDVPTRWSSASTPGAPSDPLPSDPAWAGGDLYVDERRRRVDAPREALWQIIEGIGGDRGWYSFPLGWWVRGLIDRISGGPGLRRGRRNPDSLMVGDSLDFWRVEEIVPGRRLRLRAEMRLPGLAWLELEVDPMNDPVDGPVDGAADVGADAEHTVFRQSALFHPHGLLGHAYWAAVWPFHGLVFGSMQRNVARAAERLARSRSGGHGQRHDDGSRLV